MEWVRFPIVIGLASGVTFGLFWSMQALINVAHRIEEGRPTVAVDFVRLRKDTEIETKKREPPKRERPEQPPPPPEINMAKNLNPDAAVGDILPALDTGVELAQATSLGVAGGDSDVVPLVRVDPEYPPRAKQQGVEGWVTVEFTISPLGTVQDPRVVEARPAYIFDRAVLKAVRRWKYSPKIENGVGVPRPGVQVTLMFEIGGGR